MVQQFLQKLQAQLFVLNITERLLTLDRSMLLFTATLGGKARFAPIEGVVQR